MNCFEARNDFVAFWRRTLANEERSHLLTHLNACATCDRAFRAFALTAPVLYSGTEPDSTAGSIPTDSRDWLKRSGRSEHRPVVRSLNRILPALAMAAAAVLAVYFAVPPRMTFEDAIAADTSNAEMASYPAPDGFFGQELMAQGTTTPDVADE